MSEAARDVVLIALGWLLGVVSQSIERHRQQYLERRRVLTRASSIVSSIYLEMELSRAGKEIGFIQTLEGMFDLDESWTSKIPSPPPTLPQDYGRVSDEIGDWEARQGKNDLSRHLLNLKGLVEGASEIYAVLEKAAREQVDIPDRALGFYRLHIDKIRESVVGLSGKIRKARRGRVRRVARKAIQLLQPKRRGEVVDQTTSDGNR